MKKIGLLSDSHGYLDKGIINALEGCDEIWHGGDFGNGDVAKKLRAIAPIKGVYGNIDGADIRGEFGEYVVLENFNTKALIIHIGGYPGKYSHRAQELIAAHRPDLFISGHSHILKIMRDKNNQLLHFNPGACGQHGFHVMRTLILFSIDYKGISDVKVVELGKRGKIY